MSIAHNQNSPFQGYTNTDNDNDPNKQLDQGNLENTEQIKSFGVMASFKEGGVKSEKIICAIMFMICKDNIQPLSIVEDEGFKYLMKAVSPNFKVPSHIWTDIQTRSYIDVTIHFVDQYKFNAALLGVYELYERHTSEYIATKLVDVCTEWNITKQKIVAVNAISSVSKLTDLISKVKIIVKWFKHSVVASDELRKATNVDVPSMISAKEIKDISDIIDLLRPIEASTKELCGQKYITSSLVKQNALKRY
ncbi:PREDICTED: uncharacterized protein LOC107169219 [Diuraphis noxia]|uniref:uncharacterized protein LOC107169219 n=1 Tax=Diuraphis noxia TaxID=143948 RepID=UPI0007636661|nr:PREDICTED: uncharacterized protein LOC107169219 [Diuraphis noxia]